MKIYYDEKIKDYIYSAGIPDWQITDVKTDDEYKLILTFVTGERKIFDFKPLLNEYPFEALKNKALFKKAFVCCGVAWNDDVDIDPEYLYENSIPLEEAQ